MNSDQIGGIVRNLIMLFAGYALDWGFTNEQWLTVAASVSALVVVAWSLYSNSDRKMIETVANQQDVHKVVIRDPSLVLGFDNPKVTAK